MSGIAGAVDLSGERTLPTDVLQAMADALAHRGPDEEGFFRQASVALASRRLSIVGLSDGQQPSTNEDGSIAVVCNGALFDYRERRAALEARGHRFATRGDTELLPHLWEEHGEAMFQQLRGQYAFALWDRRQQRLLLARDRFGICPLYWTRQGDWLLFASEIKALLATGMVPARADRRGLNHAFTFFAMPGPVTAFEGISLLLPGHYLDIRPGQANPVRDRIHWEIDFPDAGQEEDPSASMAVASMEEALLRAVERRLRADVPVAAYLSGGIDSSMVVAMAGKLRGSPMPTFTIRIDDPQLDETSDAAEIARHVSSTPAVVHCGVDEVLGAYPSLVTAVEGPIAVTVCAAMLLLAERVHTDGYKVALTGEGADDILAGYPWYKLHKLLSMFDLLPGVPVSQWIRKAYLRWLGVPRFPAATVRRIQELVGGHNGWIDAYGMLGVSKLRLYSESMREVMLAHEPYADLQLNRERLLRWHPLNRALYLGLRVQLPGLLLSAKGDRAAMHSAVEPRYPFLDEEVFAVSARLHPRWKLHGFREKYLLRLVAERWLPKSVAWRPKALFRAPFDTLDMAQPPAFVEQLFSRESLLRTGYFNADAVQHWRLAFRQMRARSTQRYAVEMGLAGVLSTQLWHHTYLGGGLADLPTWSVSKPASLVMS